jgi:hypothetical protein
MTNLERSEGMRQSDAAASEARQSLLDEFLNIGREQSNNNNNNSRLERLLPWPNRMPSRQERLDREIDQLPKEAKEWLERIARQIDQTGKLPQDVRNAFDRAGNNGDIKLDWINRILERNGSPHRIEIKPVGGGHTMELRRKGNVIDKHHAPSMPGGYDRPGIFEEEDQP